VPDNEFGDFQTPLPLARQALEVLARWDRGWRPCPRTDVWRRQLPARRQGASSPGRDRRHRGTGGPPPTVRGRGEGAGTWRLLPGPRPGRAVRGLRSVWAGAGADP